VNDAIRGIGRVLAMGAVLLLAGCATPGGYGGYPGDYGPSGSGYPTDYGNRLEGTVEGVDTGYGRIVLVVDDPRAPRTQRLDVRYDQRTRLFYQGREGEVQGLERGDVIRIDAVQSGRDLWARSIEVVRNVRDGGYGGGYGYGNDLRGAVASVDTRARMIRLDGDAYGGNVQVAYDGRTTVEYQGRRYRPEDLQRGDRVRIQARQVGGNQWLAERVIVERSVGY
jgi:hypothetical protein